jgi:hypothetical protein
MKVKKLARPKKSTPQAMGQIRDRVALQQYPNRDWLPREAFAGTLSAGQEAMARSMLDPGHSEQALMERSPFPVNAGGDDIACLPGMGEFDLVVPSGETRLIFTSPNPFVACVIVNPHLESDAVGYAVAYPWSISSDTPKMPATTWNTKGFASFRCVGKSATISNITPEIYRGGVSYSAMLTTPMSQYADDKTNTNTTYDVNHVVQTEMPLSRQAVIGTSRYVVHDCNGAYLLCRPRNYHWQSIDRASKGVSPYSANTIPLIAAKSNRMYIASSSLGSGATPETVVTWASDAGVWTDAEVQSTAVHTVGVWDSCDTACMCVTSPTVDGGQTYHIKMRAAFEFLVDSSSPLRYQLRRPEPNEELSQAIIQAMVYLPRQLPESYNGFGNVWRKFKEFYNSSFGKLVKKGISTVFPKASAVFTAADQFM